MQDLIKDVKRSRCSDALRAQQPNFSTCSCIHASMRPCAETDPQSPVSVESPGSSISIITITRVRPIRLPGIRAVD